jgi:hypothetical protein
MTTLRWLLISAVLLAGCTVKKDLDLKQKEEALHRGLAEAAKKADPVRNLKEASVAIRTFKVSDAADAGIKRHEAKKQPIIQSISKPSDRSRHQCKPTQPPPPERKSQ